MTRNIALRIEYDGTDFVGSQLQKQGRSVQGALERAWEQLTQEQRRVNLAGRTDAGVHARGQVASVRTETPRDLETIRRGLNAILPEDVSVLEAWEVPYAFHARHSAIRREYRYVLDAGRAPSVLLRRHAAAAPRRLDVAAMDAALRLVIGTHDFAAFASGPPDGSTIRTCYAAGCVRAELWMQPLVLIDIAANAFLRQMVRNLVGTVVLVGEGRWSVAEFGEALQSRDRRRAGPPAPAHGLYLMAVGYPADAGPITRSSGDDENVFAKGF